MIIYYLNNWLTFTIAFSLLLIITYLMMKQSRHFYTQDVVERKFSIMELEVPATPTELRNLISGLFRLSPEQSQQSLRALRGQLLLDFVFMPLAYGCIFLLCWRVAGKMSFGFGNIVFLAFAFGQALPWICDIIENVFLLSQLKPGVEEMSRRSHRRLLLMEGIKWGFSLAAMVSAISAIAYFWCVGSYSNTSLFYLGIVVAELFFFVMLLKWTN